ncbi:MAG: FAD-dependent oxidoreductase [Pseudomonadota bacterium]
MSMATQKISANGRKVTVLGAGVAGLCAATALEAAGFEVVLVDPAPPAASASWLAGAMLGPWCEAATAPEVFDQGRGAVDWWAAHVPDVARRGTLVVTPPRDRADLGDFARRTTGYEEIGPERIAELEPDLAGRFRTALYYPDEAHLDPRAALTALEARLAARGVARMAEVPDADGLVVDCRGMAAQTHLADLRAVRGEMLVLRSHDVRLSRPVRLLHPRFPVYIVPRGDGRFMIGATMVESAQGGAITARSVMELLGAAYSLHPAFGEAEILETGAGLRPAFPDNLPRIVRGADRVHLNGMYRHGFLLAPALAQELAAQLAAEEMSHAH